MAIVINGSTGISATESSSVLGDGVVEIADISATGTPSSSNYLRGDGSWQTVSGYTNSDALTLFNASGSAPVYACRAWVNFNGQGTVAIRASGNVSSITDNGTGDYTINMTTAMSDANYSVVVCGKEDESNNSAFAAIANTGRYAQSTTAVRVNTRVPGGAAYDFIQVNAAVFR